MHHMAYSPMAPPIPHRVSVTLDRPTKSGFEKAKDAGLTSATFDLSQNINNNDERDGLADTDEVQAIMRARKCTFDEARHLLIRQRMIDAGVDPETGLPLDEKALVIDNPHNKVTVYENKNMVCGKIGNPDGDGFIGRAKTLQEAIDLAVEVPDGAFFTWHRPHMDPTWAGRLYVWTNARARAVGCVDPNQWPAGSDHVSGTIERLGLAMPASQSSITDTNVVDVDVYDGLNMVNSRVKDENADAYAGIAHTVSEAVNLACRLYEDQRLSENPGTLYFAYHDIEMPSLSVFGVKLTDSSWAGRVYAWTEERAATEGRQDPRTWVQQKHVHSGIIRFKKRTRAAY